MNDNQPRRKFSSQFSTLRQNKIKLLDEETRIKIFGAVPNNNPSEAFVRLSNKHLTKCGIDSQFVQQTNDIKSVEFPALEGTTIEEHFNNLAYNNIKDVYNYLVKFSDSALKLPSKPKEWAFIAGWTRYNKDGTFKQIKGIDEDIVVLDVETLESENDYPVIATAVSSNYWYSWCSRKLVNEKETNNNGELIAINNEKKELTIVAHFASFDRAKIREEYRIVDKEKKQKTKKINFIDTMSLHVAVGGLSSDQRLMWLRHKKMKDNNETIGVKSGEFNMENVYNVSSLNSLKETAKLHCNIDLDKQNRDHFVKGDIAGVRKDFQMLMGYCSNDVATTFEVYRKVFQKYMQKCPSLVTLNGIITMGKSLLPISKKWDHYIKTCEDLYQQRLKSVEERLVVLAEEALNSKDVYNDPWLKSLDWTTKPLKMTKEKRKKDGTLLKNGESKPYAKQCLPNKPKWYKDLYDTKSKKIKITVRSRISPILMKLKYKGHPIYYSRNYGWTYMVPKASDATKSKKPLSFKDIKHAESTGHFFEKTAFNDNLNNYYKIPHVDGESRNCGSLLAKGYVDDFANNTITSDFELAKEAIELNISCSYWISLRDRVNKQFVVGDKTKKMIIPKLLVMGTVTRRAVEPTWLTASNCKKDRIGSELKTLVEAPKGYSIVGADVDSQELWISSLLSDAQFNFHGSTAIGWMTLCGNKQTASDMHSRTANILSISRGNAKIFNYGRIYGAGVNFAKSLLKQFNPKITEQQAFKDALKLYRQTKGVSFSSNDQWSPKKFYYGGSESYLFNILEKIADNKAPKTPVLGCSIPDSLKPENVEGVDYLHLLITAMDYLIHKYDIEAQYMISIHDEIRYLVKDQDKFRLCLALQISNIWTRAMFSYKVNIYNLPLSVAFFSEVDIDHIMRKEVTMNCITPSQPNKINPGLTLDIHSLAKHVKSLGIPKFQQLAKSPIPSPLKDKDALFEYKDNLKHSFFLQMQTCQTPEEIIKLMKSYKEKNNKVPKQKQRQKPLHTILTEKNNKRRIVTTKTSSPLFDKVFGVNKAKNALLGCLGQAKQDIIHKQQ